MQERFTKEVRDAMSMEGFAKCVQMDLADRFGKEYEVIVQDFEKNNHVFLKGLTIFSRERNVSPTIYLEPYYERYFSETMTLENVVDDIANTYYERLPEEDFDSDSILNFEQVSSNIIAKLVNAERNEELLKHVPHIMWNDLAIVFQVLVEKRRMDFATILVRNRLMSMWDVDAEQLMECAKINTPKLLPLQVDSMGSFLGELVDMGMDCDLFAGVDDTIGEIHIVTNEMKINGAISCFYPGILKELADKLESDLVLLPSSVHEFLIIKGSSQNDVYWNNMIQEVNAADCVSEEEIHSDHAYYFRRDHAEEFGTWG